MVGFWMQCHQLDHMQTVCTSLQTDNHTSWLSVHQHHLIFTGRMLFLMPNQQCQSTYGQKLHCIHSFDVI